MSSRRVAEGSVGGAYQSVAGDVRAVLLVDDDGIVDVRHHEVFEDDPPNAEGEGVHPRLDPHTVRGASECAVSHRHPHHVLLVLVPAQAADTDAVAGAAEDLRDADVGGAFS